MNYICLKLLKIIKNPYKIKYNWYKHFCIKKVSDKKYLEAQLLLDIRWILIIQKPIIKNCNG